CDVFPFTRRVTLRALIWYSVLHVYGHMGTPIRRWNALSVVSGALGEPSRAPLKFLSVRHDVLYSDGYPLAVIGPLRHNFRNLTFLDLAFPVSFPIYHNTAMFKIHKKLKKSEITNIDIYMRS